jgi:xanthine dehydrogenase YagS FAD-binding subunit
VKPFTFAEPTQLSEAIHLLHAGGALTRPIAGGSDLLGELKEGTAQAEHLVSLSRIAELREVTDTAAGLRLGAGLTLAQLEREPRLTGPFRIVAEAARGVATPEIRNQGTLGGNLCQRPRCFHFRSPWLDCLKKSGATCPAEHSPHQHYLSIFGGPRCFAVHASDLAPPLLALDASLVIAGRAGERTLALRDFFAGPEADPRRENVLGAGDVVRAVLLPKAPERWSGTYLKSRERTAGDFPIVSIAAGCDRSGGVLHGVRLVLGGVAPVPRPCPEAEALLEGQVPSEALVQRAVKFAFQGATPLGGNGYKVDLGRALVARAIRQVAGLGSP